MSLRKCLVIISRVVVVRVSGPFRAMVRRPDLLVNRLNWRIRLTRMYVRKLMNRLCLCLKLCWKILVLVLVLIVILVFIRKSLGMPNPRCTLRCLRKCRILCPSRWRVNSIVILG